MLNASGETDLSKLSAADKDLILADIVAAGQVIDLTVNVSKLSNGQYSIVAKDASGSTVLTFNSNQVKQTGVDNSIIYVGFLMIILAAGSVVVLRKNTITTAALA